MPSVVYTLVVYAKKGNAYEVFLYGPGETAPTNAWCTVAVESPAGKPDKKKLREKLKVALAAKGVNLNQVTNLNSF